MPLPFWLQLGAQLASIAVYQRRLVLTSCSTLINDPAMLPMLHSLWGSCRKAIAALLLLLGLTGDTEIALWAARSGIAADVTSVADYITSVSEAGGDMGVCHNTVMLMLVVGGVLLPLPAWVLLELRLREQFYAQELLAAESAQQQQQQQQPQASQRAINRSTPTSSEACGGDNWRWRDGFHMPVAALAQAVLAVSMLVLLGLVKLGPQLLQLQGVTV
jgi:hypothetical protein